MLLLDVQDAIENFDVDAMVARAAAVATGIGGEFISLGGETLSTAARSVVNGCRGLQWRDFEKVLRPAFDKQEGGRVSFSEAGSALSTLHDEVFAVVCNLLFDFQEARRVEHLARCGLTCDVSVLSDVKDSVPVGTDGQAKCQFRVEVVESCMEGLVKVWPADMAAWCFDLHFFGEISSDGSLSRLVEKGSRLRCRFRHVSEEGCLVALSFRAQVQCLVAAGGMWHLGQKIGDAYAGSAGMPL